jgi:hypothetical protein
MYPRSLWSQELLQKESRMFARVANRLSESGTIRIARGVANPGKTAWLGWKGDDFSVPTLE